MKLKNTARTSRRAAAYFLDLLVVYGLVVITLFLSVMALGVLKYGGDDLMMRAIVSDPSTRLFAQAAHVVLLLSYFTIAHWYFGRTVGKWILGLEVRHEGQVGLSFARSFGRSLGYLVSGQLTLGIGFLFPLFRADGRTLHDLLVNTDVAPLAGDRFALPAPGEKSSGKAA